MFKRKILKDLENWRNNSAGRTAALIEGARRIGKSTAAFFWLDDARLDNLCRNATDSTVGLGLYEDNSSFKCYMGDTGLLTIPTLLQSLKLLIY